MIKLIGLILILFFIANMIGAFIYISKESQKRDMSILKSILYIFLDLLLGTFGLYVAIVLGSLILGIYFIFYF
ncbi:hypothetical protein MKZ08_07850 [Viridibacillus sp. FSL R5-0477]|uniref:Uncharacterized protein n=1 Tax=Viridibacillus arenosi FSL R5-213 TaxID=1227360 RepID=W4EZQ0_9BACL|nr:hypothetical protein [Viridibacillus arenosi]ETT85522.1 hypothetical protein C176_11014 [Viridibacillus arenosi FSL R5-213]OMC87014.1 hypothetical protein BK137_21330 [Viridibacillus arenosi]